MKKALLTVATVDYIPIALIALESARKNIQADLYYLFVTNVSTENVKALAEMFKADYPWLVLLTSESLDENVRKSYESLRESYSRAEHAMIGKFFSIELVLNYLNENDIVTFLDSDLYFINTFEIEDVFSGQSLVALTPQLCSPIGDDAEHDIMIHGWINSGFMIFKKAIKTLEIVGWLKDRMFKRGMLAPFLGLSGDQTWVAALPFLYSEYVTILFQKNINVAYWNLKERNIELQSDGRYLINRTQELIFFHFSGFIPNSPKISKHSDLLLKDYPAVGTLHGKYRENYLAVSEKMKNLKDINILNNSSEKIYSRIKTHQNFLGHNLYRSMPKIGMFTRLGMILDAILRRLKIN